MGWAVYFGILSALARGNALRQILRVQPGGYTADVCYYTFRILAIRLRFASILASPSGCVCSLADTRPMCFTILSALAGRDAPSAGCCVCSLADTPPMYFTILSASLHDTFCTSRWRCALCCMLRLQPGGYPAHVFYNTLYILAISMRFAGLLASPYGCVCSLADTRHIF